MTDEQFTEIDEHLQSLGWAYNTGSERFENAARADADPELVEWEDVLVAMPDLSLNELMGFGGAKTRRIEALPVI